MFQKYLTRNRKRGFTLIEMIVVIAIIAVLIALVAPLLTKYLDTAKQTRASAAAKSIYTAAQAYASEEVQKPGGSVPDGDVTSAADTKTTYDAIMAFIDNTGDISDVKITFDGGVVTVVTCKVDGKSAEYPLP